MKSRVCSLVLGLLIALFIFGGASCGSIVEPYYLYATTVTSSLELNGNTAKCLGLIKPKNRQETTISVRLQKKSGNGSMDYNLYLDR